MAVDMKALPTSGHVFHGGCQGCTQYRGVCPKCKYFLGLWDLPDYNPLHGQLPINRWERLMRSWKAARIAWNYEEAGN